MSTKLVPEDSGNVALRRWWRSVGSDAVRQICDRADICYEYFKHCAAGRRRFSVDMARRFLAAAGPDATLTLDVLTPPKAPARRRVDAVVS